MFAELMEIMSAKYIVKIGKTSYTKKWIRLKKQRFIKTISISRKIPHFLPDRPFDGITLILFGPHEGPPYRFRR